MSMKKVGLFVTCLADFMRPPVAQATLHLLRAAGVEVMYPPTQTCCGQIAFNSGYNAEARALVQKCADEFADCEYVVVPSGSCCGLLRTYLDELFPADSAAVRFGAKCLELSEYLQQAGYTPPPLAAPVTVTYHDSCAGLRELGIRDTPRRLLRQAGVQIIEMTDCEECCGFGGLFSVQFGELSAALADKKCRHITETGAAAVVAGDIGCLLHLEGRLRRLGSELPALHWAEVLTGALNGVNDAG